MSEKSVVITEKDGKYHIENNGISEFALLGILECIVFDLKSAKRQLNSIEQTPQTIPVPNTHKETVQESKTPDLRTRISNAVKAIKGLGGQVPDFDLSNASDNELQEELESLTEQYKRLKNSKGANK